MKMLALAMLVVAGSAQTFDVASIRPHAGPISMIGTEIAGPLVTSSAMAVHDLITYAYDVRTYQVSGVPYGLEVKERYDISARVPGEAVPAVAQVRKMYQTLLTERFQLKFHRETKEMDVYGLVVAKGGHKLREPTAPEDLMRMKGNSMIFTAAPMSMLVRQLGAQPGIDRPVLDKTGLPGKYDFQLNYAGNPREGITGPDGESIFTAVEEQLGLKLERQKASIEVLVVDSVQKPSEN